MLGSRHRARRRGRPGLAWIGGFGYSVGAQLRMQVMDGVDIVLHFRRMYIDGSYCRAEMGSGQLGVAWRLPR